MLFTYLQPPQGQGRMTFTLILQVLVWCVLFMLPFSEASGSQCFRPSGALAENDYPCEPLHIESFCCGVGWACAMDKVCYPTSAIGVNWVDYTPSRGSCTDFEWTSNECPKYCLSDLDNLDDGQSFYQCPSSDPPTYCCHEKNCNCTKGGDFKLPTAARISIIVEPTKSSIVVRPATNTLAVIIINRQTIISSVVETSALTVSFSPYTNTPLPSEQSTSSPQAQSTSSQSPEVNQANATGAASTNSGARKFDIDIVMPVAALTIGALVLLVLRH